MTKKQIVFNCEWFQVINENGYYYIKQKDGVAGSVIVPVINDNLLFLIQKRPATSYQETLEFPRGALDGNESPLKCAIRELQEETQILATQQDIKNIGELLPDTGILTSRVAVFIAQTTIDESDIKISDESASFRLIPIKDVPAAIKNREISCGITLAALALYNAQV